jgi:hypothetical protein
MCVWQLLVPEGERAKVVVAAHIQPVNVRGAVAIKDAVSAG